MAREQKLMQKAAVIGELKRKYEHCVNSGGRSLSTLQT